MPRPDPSDNPGPRRIDGARALLMERLLDGAPATHDRDSLTAALAVSIERLLAVRAPAGSEARQAAARTVLDYGAPSLEQFSPTREADRKRLATALREAVAAFEPRLENPEVSVEPGPEAGDALVARISGQLRLGGLVEPFSFVTPVDPGGSRDHGR